MIKNHPFLWNSTAALFGVGAALVADVAIPFFSGYGLPLFKPGYLALLFVFFLALSLIKSHIIIGILIAFCGSLTLFQCAHIAYFGTYMTPIRFQLLLMEADEIAESASGVIQYLWFVIPLSLLPWYAAYKLLTRDARFTFPYAWIISLLILAFIPIRLYTRPLQDAYPNPSRFCFINSLHSFFGYCIKIVPGQKAGILHFHPYTVHATGDGTPGTIVLIMGESFSSTHMDLYGYNRPTTPFLSSLARDTHFYYWPGYAAGVATKTSLPLFYNTVREPGNVNAIESKTTNLFRLAKAHGYETVYISAQHANILFGVGAEFVDHVITVDDAPKAFEIEKDEALLTLLKTIPLKGKAFIVLHQRSLHSPYEAGYALCKACHRYPTKNLPYKEFMQNTYDNGVIYNDQLYQKIMGYLQQQYGKGPLYIFITSDHGERLGEHGKYGHSELDIDVAKVPWMVYASHDLQGLLQSWKTQHLRTHYDMGLFIAQLLGYTITNPNDDGKTFYINGNHILGLEGKLTCLREKSN